MSKIIKIDSKAKTVEVVELKENTAVDSSIQSTHMRELIGCNYFEHAVLGGKIDMWFDEEYTLHEEHEGYGFTLPVLNQPILGNAIITSFDDEGETHGLEHAEETAQFISDVILFGKSKNKEG